MHAVESKAWDDWGDEEDDPFEDAILQAKDVEGLCLIDAIEEFNHFLREDIRHEIFENPEEVAEKLRIFDGLVEQAHRAFAMYIERLAAIQEEHHGHP